MIYVNKYSELFDESKPSLDLALIFWTVIDSVPKKDWPLLQAAYNAADNVAQDRECRFKYPFLYEKERVS